MPAVRSNCRRCGRDEARRTRSSKPKPHIGRTNLIASRGFHVALGFWSIPGSMGSRSHSGRQDDTFVACCSASCLGNVAGQTKHGEIAAGGQRQRTLSACGRVGSDAGAALSYYEDETGGWKCLSCGKRPFDVTGMVGDPGKAICRGCVEEFYRAFQEPDGEGEST